MQVHGLPQKHFTPLRREFPSVTVVTYFTIGDDYKQVVHGIQIPGRDVYSEVVRIFRDELSATNKVDFYSM